MVELVQFAAQSYQARALPLDAQRAVNMYPEFEPKGAKTPVPVWGCPGMVSFADCGDSPVAALDMMNGVVYAIVGQALWKVNPDGSTVNLGATLVSGPVSIDNNGVELCWVDGEAGWYYSVTAGVQQIVDENFYAADTVVFFDGYFVFNRKGTKEFFLSPLYGVTPFDGALFASKEATPDLLMGIVNSHEELLLFGQERTEVWFDAGNAPPTFPFQRFDGTFIQRGLIAPLATCLEDNTVFFLGDDGIFYRLEMMFLPMRISTHAVEKAWQSYQTMTNAFCFSYTLEGHKFVTLTFPSAPATWVYDVATRLWHERESWTGSSEDSSIGRWRANCALMAYNRVLIGDSQSGTIAELNYQVYTELGNTMRGLVTSSPIHNDRARIFMKRFELDVETGVGLPGAAELREVAYAPTGVVVTSGQSIAAQAALAGVAANLPILTFSAWVLTGTTTGATLWFSNQDDDSSPGTAGLQIGVAANSAGTLDLTVNGWDDTATAVVAASYAGGSASDWTNVLVSLDTNTQMLQVWCTTTDGPAAATAVSVVWSSAKPVGNPAASRWHLAVAS